MTATIAHVPVLLDAVVAALSPREGGVYVDGTFGAGGYTRAILEAAPCRVVAFDQDPSAIASGRQSGVNHSRLTLIEDRFGAMDRHVEAGSVAGVALDIGVSSMQVDDGARGFSFMRDGPLDMRMGAAGMTAAEIVALAPEKTLADVFFRYGDERRSRRIARAIVEARRLAPIETTGALARVIESALPPRRYGEVHPATRAFQALRIAVNDELTALIDGLEAAERVLETDGVLAVVSFHSLEDRIVKRFFQTRSGGDARPSRHAPESTVPGVSSFARPARAVAPDAAEIARNPRARSARLRWARRLDTSAPALDRARLGAPMVDLNEMQRRA